VVKSEGKSLTRFATYLKNSNALEKTADKIKPSGTKTMQIDKITNNMLQKVCIFLLVFLSKKRNGFCSKTAKKNVNKKGAVAQNKYLKNTYSNARIADKNNILIKKSFLFSTLVAIL
jgi:hypothetical protein